MQESLDNANNLAAAEANKQAHETEKLNKSIEDLKAAKTAVEEDLKKENASVEVAKGSVEELKQEIEVAKLTEKNLGAKVDLAEARITQLETQNKLALDNLAKVEAETNEKINSGRDDQIDIAMYRVWDHNQGTDISFM